MSVTTSLEAKSLLLEESAESRPSSQPPASPEILNRGQFGWALESMPAPGMAPSNRWSEPPLRSQQLTGKGLHQARLCPHKLRMWAALLEPLFMALGVWSVDLLEWKGRCAN